MKKVTLILSALVLFVTSCTKQDIQPTTPDNLKVVESFSAPSNQTVTENNKAYIFVEPQSKYLMVANYLKDSSGQNTSQKFLGFWVGNAVALQNNFTRYLNMPHWTDGRLPSVYVADVPQTSGGTDTYGNAKIAYNFTTVKIPKSVCGKSWISILIPVSAMANDTRRQNVVTTYEKLGNTLFTNGTRTFTNYTMNRVMYGYTFNYQGDVIPKGVYRLYTTYTSTGLRMLDDNTTRDLYIRGNGN